MDVNDKIDEIVKYVESARSMPMSSSSVVNRAALLGLLQDLREMLPASIHAADDLLGERDHLLAEARAEAEEAVAAAKVERDRLVSEHEVLIEAQARAEETVDAALTRADRLSGEVDDYVDAKLAHLEVAVDKILDTIRNGRERLRETSAYAELATTDTDNAPAEGSF